MKPSLSTGSVFLHVALVYESGEAEQGGEADDPPLVKFVFDFFIFR